jgi:prefoldin subunit 5
MAASSEIEVLAQELSNLAAKVLGLEKRMTEVEAVIERLEAAASTKIWPSA